MAKKQEESNVSDAIRLELCKRGCKIFRSQVGLFYTKYGGKIHIGVVGESDLHGHTPTGKAFYIESKTPIGSASKEQKKFISSMKESRCISWICSFC